MENQEEEVVELEETEFVEETPVEEDTKEEETDDTDWKAKAGELQGRLKRAETKLSKVNEKSEKAPSKSSDLGYAEKAYLATQVWCEGFRFFARKPLL